MTERLMTPSNGVTVRMYRQGHGDCFLLAFPRQDDSDDPFYILIDCGLKPGSQDYIHGKSIGDIVKHIGRSTNYHLDLVILTHEHQDHLNGIWKKRNPYFKDFTIEKAWLAWTEDPFDDLANDLRVKYKDQLLGLLNARQKLAAFGLNENNALINQLDGFLSLEFGDSAESLGLAGMLAAASDPSKSVNKQAIKLVKDKALENQGVSYLSPGGKPLALEGTAGFRAFVLGPPRDGDLLRDEDPVGEESFPAEGLDPRGLTFGAAVSASPSVDCARPFSKKYCVSDKDALSQSFYRDHYGRGADGECYEDNVETTPNAPWRRINDDWLYSAETLALKLNQGINNTSLVLAFEMPETKKVLLFAGDAQRGNWLSWGSCRWDDGDSEEIMARDLLGRVVLYKVGHHGSHNATLAGAEDSDYPNLAWMGRDGFKNEFTAMITAVNKWALEKNNPPWRHPLPSIRQALEKKAQGRVFQTDIDALEKPESVSDSDWQAFIDRSALEQIYFDYTILDE